MKMHSDSSKIAIVFMAVFVVTATVPLSAENIIVSDFNELVTAVAAANPYDVILMEDGFYQMAGTWVVQVRTGDLTIRSLSGDREAVVLTGFGIVRHGAPRIMDRCPPGDHRRYYHSECT